MTNTPNATVEMTLGGRTFTLSVTLPILGNIKRVTGRNIFKGESPIRDIEPERLADVVSEMAKPNDPSITPAFVLANVNRSNLMYVIERAGLALNCEDEANSENPSTAS